MTDRDPAGRFACYHCGHDTYEHNRIVGCPHCKCAATPGEAGTDPAGEYKDLRVRSALEPPLHEWQKRDSTEPPEPIERTRTFLSVDPAEGGQPILVTIFDRVSDGKILGMEVAFRDDEGRWGPPTQMTEEPQ